MAIININEGDYGFDLNFKITYADGTAYNITDLTVSVYARSYNYGTSAHTTIWDGLTGSVVSGTAGTCKYAVLEADTVTAKRGSAELWIVLTATGITLTTEKISLYIASTT